MPPEKMRAWFLCSKSPHRDRAPCDDLQTFSDPVPGSVLGVCTPFLRVSDFISTGLLWGRHCYTLCTDNNISVKRGEMTLTKSSLLGSESRSPNSITFVLSTAFWGPLRYLDFHPPGGSKWPQDVGLQLDQWTSHQKGKGIPPMFQGQVGNQSLFHPQWRKRSHGQFLVNTPQSHTQTTAHKENELPSPAYSLPMLISSSKTSLKPSSELRRSNLPSINYTKKEQKHIS